MAETALAPNQFADAAPVSQPVEEEAPKKVAPEPDVVAAPDVAAPTGNVLIQSDKRAEELTKEQETSLSEITKQFAISDEERKVVETEKAVIADKQVEQEAAKAAGGLTREEATAIFGTDFTGVTLDSKTGLFIPDESAQARIDTTTKQAITAQREIDDLFDSQIAEYDKIRTTLSNAGKALVDSIKGIYDKRRSQTKDINTRTLEGLRILGIRSGRNRFAPEVQSGILSSEERAGIARLSELDAEEKSLIAQAELAAIEKDFTVLNQKMNLVTEKRQEKQDILQKQLELATTAEKEALDQMNKVTRQSAIAGLIEQGVTDPAQLFDFVNFDAKGNLVGDITFEEIDEVLKLAESAADEPISFEDLGQINQELDLDLPFGVTQRDLITMGVVPTGKSAQNFEFRTVGNQILRIDKATGDTSVIFEGPKQEDPFTTQQRFQNTFGFQKEQTDNAKDFIIQRNAVGRIGTALAQESAAGDLAAIFAFMKAQDPNSVVRESEFATAAGARAEITRIGDLGIPVPTIAVQAVERLDTGKRLLAEQRKDFLDTANAVFDSALVSQIAVQAQARVMAETLGIDPDTAVPDQTLIKQKLQQQLEPGEIIVWDLNAPQNANEAIGAISVEEYQQDPSLYLIF